MQTIRVSRPDAFAASCRGVAMALALGIVGIHSSGGEELSANASDHGESQIVPEPTGDEKFAELLENSPFLRPLDLSRTLVLTGVARIEGNPFAILFDRETDESHFVTRERDPHGWSLLGIEGDLEDLEAVTARISVAGGQVISVRYDPKQLNPSPGSSGPAIPPDQAKRVAHEARNYRHGLSSDGFPGRPPPDLVEKLSKMSESQRGRIIYHMNQMRAKGAGNEERQKTFRNLVDRASPAEALMSDSLPELLVPWYKNLPWQ